MPFTVSHAIVAVPFTRTALPAGAVAAGAMVPDLPLFLPVGVSYGQTHELPWFLLVDLPLGFLAFALWRLLVRPLAARVTPGWLAARLPADWSGSAADGWRSLRGGRSWPGGLALLLAALAIGAVTHVVWDAFSHEGRWGTVLVPALDARIAGVVAANWVHYLSSVLGFAALAVWVVVWLRRRTPRATPRRDAGAAAVFWVVTAVVTLVSASVGLIGALGAAEPAPGLVDLAFALTTVLGGSLVVAPAVAGAVTQLVRRR